MREIVLDTETTGLDPSGGHRIVEIGCVELVNKVPTGNTYHKYINPMREMPTAAYEVHKLSSEFLAQYPPFHEVLESFKEFIAEDPLVIHNAEFDMRFINYEFTLLKNAELPASRAIDTLKIARKQFPGAQASLDALCRRFEIDNSERTSHGALLDAQLLAKVYLELSGGAQPVLTMESNAEDSVVKKTEKPFREPRVFDADDEEHERHQEFLEKITDPIWAEAN